ncbi:LegC family aminotransferase [Brevibacillus sp. SYSU BS000544]|uniref:LegC family aminotransferase n=1 Tax=Brevibacillus sp. SYSU BS000544 TaxID=3416443 RepID=UPI003CE4957E
MSKHIIEQIVQTLSHVVNRQNEFVPLHEPEFSEKAWIYVKECLDSGWVSSVGKYVDLFEKQLEEITGAKKAVAVVNGTAALHICLQLVGVRQDDEVLIPTLTFIATANAVAYCGSIPHFVDSEEKTIGVDPNKLSSYLGEITEIRSGECFNKLTGRRIKAIVPMHTFGHPVNIDPLRDICERFRLELVEDAAESLGSYYKGVHTGNFGKVATLSFNGNKIVTTGGGGAILTNDEALGKMAKHLTTTAKIKHSWAFEHDQIGYNYRLPNLNAALGCAQLEDLPRFIENKRLLAEQYIQEFALIKGVKVIKEPDFAKSNYWLNALLLDSEYKHLRESILEKTNEIGIMTRPVWNLLHTLTMYQHSPRMDVSKAIDLAERLINIPSSAKLGEFNVKT